MTTKTSSSSGKAKEPAAELSNPATVCAPAELPDSLPARPQGKPIQPVCAAGTAEVEVGDGFSRILEGGGYPGGEREDWGVFPPRGDYWNDGVTVPLHTLEDLVPDLAGVTEEQLAIEYPESSWKAGMPKILQQRRNDISEPVPLPLVECLYSRSVARCSRYSSVVISPRAKRSASSSSGEARCPPGRVRVV